VHKSFLQSKFSFCNLRTRGPNIRNTSRVKAEPERGTCWLVGAGPGAPDLLTLRAAKVIAEADVILYDDLGTQDIVEQFSRPQTKRVFVGKRGGRESVSQDSINKLLVESCLEVVV